MRSLRSSVSSAGSRTRPSSIPRKITLSVVGTWSSAGVDCVSCTGAAGRGAAIGPGVSVTAASAGGSDVVVVVVLVELVVDVDVELVVVARDVVDDCSTWAPSTWARRRDADALGIADATATDAATSTAHRSAKRRGRRFKRPFPSRTGKCTNRTGAGDTRGVPRSQDGRSGARDA